MSEQLRETVFKEIQKTGYPFELQVSKSFENKSWSVDHNSYYIDKDENKGREIDLITGIHRGSTTEDYYIEFTLNLIIEIKQSVVKPWVFFTTKASEFESILGFPKSKAITGFSAPSHYINETFYFHGTKINPRLGRSFYEALAKGNKRDDIYKALSGVAKATSHAVESSGIEEFSDKLLYYYEPVIIFNGTLFEAYLNDDDCMEINEVNQLQVAFNYLSPNYACSKYIVQFVTVNSLSDFIKEKEETANDIFAALINKEMKYTINNVQEK